MDIKEKLILGVEKEFEKNTISQMKIYIEEKLREIPKRRFKHITGYIPKIKEIYPTYGSQFHLNVYTFVIFFTNFIFAILASMGKNGLKLENCRFWLNLILGVIMISNCLLMIDSYYLITLRKYTKKIFWVNFGNLLYWMIGYFNLRFYGVKRTDFFKIFSISYFVLFSLFMFIFSFRANIYYGEERYEKGGYNNILRFLWDFQKTVILLKFLDLYLQSVHNFIIFGPILITVFVVTFSTLKKFCYSGGIEGIAQLIIFSNLFGFLIAIIFLFLFLDGFIAYGRAWIFIMVFSWIVAFFSIFPFVVSFE